MNDPYCDVQGNIFFLLDRENDMHFSFSLTSLYIEQTRVKLFFFLFTPLTRLSENAFSIIAKWTRFDKAFTQTSFHCDWLWVHSSYYTSISLILISVILPDVLSVCILKSGPHLCAVCFIEKPLKMTKNAFYFILKALKIFKFLSWLFGHVEKMAWLER